MSYRTMNCHRSGCRGFSLIEMIVVMAIIVILLCLVVPTSNSFQQSKNITFAGQSVTDEIAVARQMAASRNLAVEVRFIAPASWVSSGSPAYTGYHVVQLWAPNELGVSVPLDTPVTLPNGIEVSGSTTIMAGNTTTLSPLLTTYAQNPPLTIASGITAGNYVSFFVRPDGNVINGNLAVTVPTPNIQYYFLTVVPVQADGATKMPSNYLTLQINPDTGYTQAYFP